MSFASLIELVGGALMLAIALPAFLPGRAGPKRDRFFLFGIAGVGDPRYRLLWAGEATCAVGIIVIALTPLLGNGSDAARSAAVAGAACEIAGLALVMWAIGRRSLGPGP